MIGDADGGAGNGTRRLTTGIREMDRILGGGFVRNSLNIIMGYPGTGKTVFMEQMVFHNAADDRPILYLTTMSEPLEKLIGFLQSFTFYDPDRMLAGVVYEDLGQGLAEHGPQLVLDHVKTAVRELGPRIVVIDSFKAIHDLSESTADMRRLISELAVALTAYDVTVFLVGEYINENVGSFPEFAVADGIVELSRRGTPKRDDRFVRVLKLRGSAYLEGLHAFTIDEDGLHVYPRLVAPEFPPTVPLETEERVSTGIEGLDRILDGGLIRGNSVLVLGPAGSGKTTVGLQFALEGIRTGEPALFLNFQEHPAQLARTVRSLGVDLAEVAEQGLEFQYVAPVELSIDSIVGHLLQPIEERGIRRVVIDAVGDLAVAAGDEQRFHDYLYALSQHLVGRGITLLMTFELYPDVRGQPLRSHARFSSMADALILLDMELTTTPRRVLRVGKARGIAHDLRPHEFVIEIGGVRVLGPLGDPR